MSNTSVTRNPVLLLFTSSGCADYIQTCGLRGFMHKLVPLPGYYMCKITALLLQCLPVFCILVCWCLYVASRLLPNHSEPAIVCDLEVKVQTTQQLHKQGHHLPQEQSLLRATGRSGTLSCTS